MRIVFAGTPDFAVPSLTALIEETASRRLEVVSVMTQPDRAAGRGRVVNTSPVKKIAQAAGIEVLQPPTLKTSDARSLIAAQAPDLLVVVAYGLLLPAKVLAIPRLGCVNVHASLLPRWRGAAPIQHALLAGDGKTGVAIMRMNKGLDEGPVYLSQDIPIAKNETGSTLHDKLAALGAEKLIEALPGIFDGSLIPQSQDDSEACYAGKIGKEDAKLDFSLEAVTLERQVRAYNAWPVAWCCWSGHGNATLRIWSGHVSKEHDASVAPGTVTAADRGGVRIQTGKQTLVADSLQLPGRRPVTAQEFCNAWKMAGERLT